MPLKATLLLATVTGSRRRTGAPRSQRGTRLKATTDRAFLVSTGSPTPARATVKSFPSLPGERAATFPNQSTAAQSGLSLLASLRLHRAMRPERSYPTSRLSGSPSLGPGERGMTERIQEFLRHRRGEGLDPEPCLVVDLEIVRDNYQTFAKA